jgi:hypothetical protein
MELSFVVKWFNATSEFSNVTARVHMVPYSIEKGKPL